MEKLKTVPALVWFIGAFTILIVIGVVSAAPQARADAVISGPVCIIDGNTIQVGEKVKNGKCWGGISVRLHGSIAPKLNDTCTDADGNVWNCGQKAKDALANIIRMNNVSCYHLDGEFFNGTPISTCISGRSDLAMELVKSGMAKALNDQSNRYELEEKDAKQAKRGLWK